MGGDGELLERWRAGEKAAGEELFRRHFADVLRFFDNKVWSKAEDLTQQTFLECLRSQHRFRGDSSFRTYLFAIAWNQLRHHFRRELNDVQVDFDSSSIAELAASMTSPPSAIDRTRRARRVHQALAQLPVAQQTLLELHYWQGLEAADLSEVFAVPAGAIRVRLLRARNALRDQLAGLNSANGSQSEVGEDDLDDPLTESLNRLAVEDRNFKGPAA
jgi:RNA polymerase sigma-70 factor (ECF subfamily)